MPNNDRGGRSGPKKRARNPVAPIVRRGTLRLQHDVARRIRAGHPWIYREAIDIKRVAREKPGNLVELVDWDGEFVGRGYYDGETAIAIRVVTLDPARTFDAALIAERVRSAVELRNRTLDTKALEAVRLIHGEADGLPGMTVDRYGDFLVCQLFCSGALSYREQLYDALEDVVGPKSIYEQRRFRPLSGDSAPRSGAELIRGSVAPVEIEVAEDDLRFVVDVTAPLSTGLFADLREGRRAIARWAKGRRVLNLFSYTGAISVYSAYGGAEEVVAVDVAAKAHARARKNFTASGLDPERCEHIVGDTFKVLAKFKDRGRQFDLVAIDPPAFASGNRDGKPWSAVKDYGELVSAALDVLSPGGLLAAASSTHKLSQQDFDNALADGARRSKTRLRIFDRRALPADFPTTPGFPEGNYLKFVVAARD